MSWKNFFRTKNTAQLVEALDLGVLHTDIHSHLIPGIDDGSKSMEESLNLIEQLYELGYRKLIITPHIMNDYYKNTPEIIHKGLEELRIQLEKNTIAMEVEVAAEYMLDDGFEAKIKAGNLLTFGDNYILVEMSYMAEPPNLASLLFELQTEGYRVVLAHPERYTYWHNNFNKYQEMVDRGVILQMNINSLTAWYSEASKQIAHKLIRADMIRLLGSDLHNQNYLNELKKSRYIPLLKDLLANPKLLNTKL